MVDIGCFGMVSIVETSLPPDTARRLKIVQVIHGNMDCLGDTVPAYV
jgi:hypothetical protein